METARYTIPGLVGNADASSGALTQDLMNALTVLDGVGHVQVDRNSHVVTVDFDPDYMDLETLAYYVKGTGYPVAEARA